MARSCGKTILLGEHAVVYGVPAVVAGLERGASAVGSRAAVATLRVGDRSAQRDDGTELGAAFSALLDSLGAGPLQIEVTLEIPAGVGLGASATIAVAAARAAIEAEGGTLEGSMSRVVDAAMAWERVFHGNPSGIDAWAAAHGGCLSYVRGEGAKPLRVGRPLPLCVAVAGPAASTRTMVEGLAQLVARKPELTQKSFDGIRSLVDNAILCIETGDLPSLGQLMNLNQMLLAGLYLSTQEIETACATAREAGALGAKLTGSGGGGCVVALADDPERVLAAWGKLGLYSFSTVVPSSSQGSPVHPC